MCKNHSINYLEQPFHIFEQHSVFKKLIINKKQRLKTKQTFELETSIVFIKILKEKFYRPLISFLDIPNRNCPPSDLEKVKPLKESYVDYKKKQIYF